MEEDSGDSCGDNNYRLLELEYLEYYIEGIPVVRRC